MVLEKESGKEALYDGGVMVGASLLSDAVVNSWVSPFTPAGSSLVFAEVSAMVVSRQPGIAMNALGANSS